MRFAAAAVTGISKKLAMASPRIIEASLVLLAAFGGIAGVR